MSILMKTNNLILIWMKIYLKLNRISLNHKIYAKIEKEKKKQLKYNKFKFYN